jgi:glucosamine-6-phosphate deaminase
LTEDCQLADRLSTNKIMRIIKAKDYQDMSRKAANIISAQIIMKPDCVLGLATGSSVLGTYRQLIDWYNKGDLDFSSVRTVNLDEYKGIRKDNAQSYSYFMRENLFRYININCRNTHIPDGMAADEKEECERYRGIIRSLGGIDLQLLGLGHNGHIGFNEPDESFEKEIHCVALTESTINANSRFFSSLEEVPGYAFTMGIKSIMQARRILVVVSGKDKAEILRTSFLGEITPKVPATILQLHNDVTVVADEEALSGMEAAGITA